jgi:hypothetical protein
MPRDPSGWFQHNAQMHLEFAKFGFSSTLAFLALGIGSSWYAAQAHSPTWSPIVATVGCFSALVIGLLSFCYFLSYVRNSNAYAELKFGSNPTTARTTSRQQGSRTSSGLWKFCSDAQDEFWRMLFEGLGIAALTTVALSKFETNRYMAAATSGNVLLLFITGVASLALAALLKIDIQDRDARLRRLPLWLKWICSVLVVSMVLIVWFIIVQPFFG